MNPKDITLLIGLDGSHLEELRWTWPTWMCFKPELREMPALVFYDPVEIDPARFGFLHDHPNLRWVPWDWAYGRTQREKMITGFVHIPAREVQTPWYLKLDTDAAATNKGVWMKDEWFQPDARGRLPVFVSSKWSYSKPRYVLNLLDDWADGVRELQRFPRLDIPYSSNDKNRIRHRRIISWIFFGRTDWTKKVVGWLGPDGRMPWASQDTFLFYCAKRSRQRMVRERMTGYGWLHTRLPNIQRKVRSLGLAPLPAEPIIREI